MSEDTILVCVTSAYMMPEMLTYIALVAALNMAYEIYFAIFLIARAAQLMQKLSQTVTIQQDGGKMIDGELKVQEQTTLCRLLVVYRDLPYFSNSMLTETFSSVALN